MMGDQGPLPVVSIAGQGHRDIASTEQSRPLIYHVWSNLAELTRTSVQPGREKLWECASCAKRCPDCALERPWDLQLQHTLEAFYFPKHNAFMGSQEERERQGKHLAVLGDAGPRDKR